MMKALKTAFLFLMVLLFTLIFAATKLIFFFLVEVRLRLMAGLIHLFSCMAVVIMGIKIDIRGQKNFCDKHGVFFVTNHTTYLDGIVTSSIFSLLFIGKSDIRRWPVFGLFSFFSETIFINRTDPASVPKELKKITYALNNGANVILFPEGTSTDGTALRPFKSSFFEAAIAAKTKVVPIAIKYKKIDGEDLGIKNRDKIFWYGDMEFMPHLAGVLGLKNINVEVNILPPIDASGMEDRKDLCGLAQGVIGAALK